MVCPQCGKDASEYASFCSYCGGPLRQEAQFQANTAESVQHGYEGKVPPPPEYVQNSYTPAQPSNPYTPAQPPNSYTPAQPLSPYTPAQPLSPYTPAQPPSPYTPAQPPSPYTPAQPPNSYTPAQPPNSYTPAQPPSPYTPAQLPNSYTPAPPSSPYTPAQPPKRRKGTAIILVSAIAALIIISSIIGVSAYKQQSAEHIAATSTALTGLAHAHATGTVIAEVSATAQARANPYSPTMQTLNSISLTSQQDTANWNINANCTYKQGYAISTTNGQLVTCLYNKIVDGNYTVELSVNINNDNAEGGIILRETSNAIEILYINKGQVTLQVFDSQKKQNILLKKASAPIKVNVDTLIGVVADHGVMTVFVNHENALTIDDNRADIGQQYLFGLIATSLDNKGASTAIYKNVKLWTV